MVERLKLTVLRSADSKIGDWFNARLAVLTDGYDREVFLAAYAGAGRRLRAFAVDADSDDLSAARALGVGSLSEWGLDRFARCVMLSVAVEAAAGDERAGIVDEVFRVGDNAEREALLAGLLLLSEPGQFLSTAVEACRSNVETVFSALACENAYPSVYFPDANFNQMVMKAVFIGIPLVRVVGLVDRRNDELARMARNYASERSAAGRFVSDDLELIAAPAG
jgi:hypothetical protein